MSVYKIVHKDHEDDTVEWYGAEIGDIVEIADPTPYSNVWLKGSKVFDKEWQRHERLCVADSMEDFHKYVEKV